MLTQNIDGFHRDAGSDNLIEIHGNVHEMYCTSCADEFWLDDYSSLHSDGVNTPSCHKCGGAVRPKVVLFGEMLPSLAMQRMRSELRQGFDMVLSIGTTSAFPYISGPVLEAKRWGSVAVEINPGETEVSDYVHYKVAAGAANSLDFLWQQMYS